MADALHMFLMPCGRAGFMTKAPLIRWLSEFVSQADVTIKFKRIRSKEHVAPSMLLETPSD